MKRVTLDDVARHCGVSAMTVSCVYRGILCVKEATREKVEAAIKELGYTSDPTLRALAYYRKQAKTETESESCTFRSSIAYLDSEPTEFNLMMHADGVKEAAKLGYRFEYFELPASLEEQQKLSRKLWLQGIHGIILAPAQDEKHLDGFCMEHFSFVSIGAFHHSPPVDSVGLDYFQGLYLAARKCWEAGHRGVALFLPEYLESRTGHRWLGAYRAFCDHYRVSPRIWLYPKDVRPDKAQFVQWLEREEIDAVLTLCKYPPVRRTDRKVRFVSLNDWHIAPGWWHVAAPSQIIIREGIRLLEQNLLHQEYGIPKWPKQISINGVWFAK